MKQTKSSVYNDNQINELTTRTFPIITESTIFGSTLPAAKAAFAATTCNSVDEVLTNLPPYVPNGVLLAATIKIPKTEYLISFCSF